LPSVKLTFVTTLASTPTPWLANGEEVLDAEAVHAIAPDAKITVLLVAPTSLNTATSAVSAFIAAIKLAASEGGVVSISAAGQTGGEHCDSPAQLVKMNAALETAVNKGVTVVAASGDVGAVGEPCDVIKGLFRRFLPPGKGSRPARGRPVGLGRGRHHAERQSQDRRLPG